MTAVRLLFEREQPSLRQCIHFALNVGSFTAQRSPGSVRFVASTASSCANVEVVEDGNATTLQR